MISHPFLSVVIPVYNSSKYISKTISSLLKQTYQNFEIVFVNDGSTDNSIDVINNAMSLCETRWKLINQENKGVSFARNVGIDTSIGDYVIALDSDDYLSDNTFESLATIIEQYPQVDALFFDFEIVSPESDNVGNIRLEKYQLIDGQDAVSLYFYRKKNFISPACLAKRAFLQHFLIRYDTKCKFAEDDLFVWHVLSESKEIAYVESKFYKYVRHENSVMTSSSIEKYLSSYASAKKYDKEIICCSQNCKSISAYFLARHVFGLLHASSKTLNYLSFYSLTLQTNWKELRKKLFKIRKFKIKFMCIISFVSNRLFYFICKHN